MAKMFQAIFLLSLVSFSTVSYSLPLSTRGRWIVDAETGKRVKFACVNWASHLQPMIAEGLDKRPLKDIVAKLVKHHFNCVRLTWPTFMFTREKFGQLTVTDSLDSFDLKDAKAGVAKNNPDILNMTVLQAYDSVVDELGAQGIMVLLDNHVSQPKWCCGNDDNNGFFGDSHFNPMEWLQGLATVAKRFQGKKQVVAVSTRNEPHGPHQNEHDWYKYIRKGVETIHRANPNVLAVASGLSYGRDLSFLKKRPFGSNLDNKLVFEEHWYAFSEDYSGFWAVQPSNRVCAKATQAVIDHTAFVLKGEQPVPLFLGEFGIDQSANIESDNRFLNCFLAFAAGRDLDWGLWALQGSYYLRENNVGPEETYGLLDSNWDNLRNQKFVEKLRFLQGMTQDPSSNLSTSVIMYHPQSGHPVRVNGNNKVLISNDSTQRSRWSHEGDGTPIRLMDSGLCLKVEGDGLPPTLSTDCLSQQSSWKSVSDAKLQLAAKDKNGEDLCLDYNNSDSSEILTTKCICVEDDSDCQQNPQSQWFKLVLTNIE